jgi:TonB family protein
MSITLHERLGPSCELLQPGTLRDHGQYASVSVSGIAEEIYSPELTREDFLAISLDAQSKFAALLHGSGFRFKTDRKSEETSPRVETSNGSSSCPSVQEAVRAVSEQLDQRRRTIQSKVYRPRTDGIAPPVAVFPQEAGSDASTSGTTARSASSGTKKPRYEGDVILEFIVGIDGSVSNVKIVHSARKELDEKAIEATKGLKFKPARKDGVPVTVLINTATHFRLY